jgi:transposase-like protein
MGDPHDSPGDDRPVVDGTRATPEELRAEVDRLSDERRQEADELRDDIGATVHELAGRLDVPARTKARVRTVPPAAWAGAAGAAAGATGLVVLLRARRSASSRRRGRRRR